MKLKKLENYNVNWEDCCMSLVCPFCGTSIILDSQDEDSVCDCGVTFSLYAAVYYEGTPDVYKSKE